MSAPVIEIRDDYQAEARALVEWLYGQAEFYKRHAPHLTGDIERFKEAAALLDSFQAGLVPVTFHPLMRMEVVRWIDPAKKMPLELEDVVFIAGGMFWSGYRVDGGGWVSGLSEFDTVDAWAPRLLGPQPDSSREEDASCA